MKYIIPLLSTAVILSACANNNVEPLNDVPPDAIIDKGTYVYKADAVKEQVREIPDWFMQAPESDEAIYSTGTAATADLQLSVDLAIMNAKTTLADRINGRLSSSMKSFIAKIGDEQVGASVLSEVEKATKNIIADVDVAGYKVKESHIISSGLKYRAYVLLEYSDKEANKIIMNRLRKDRMIYSAVRSTKAWKELDQSVEQFKEDEAAEAEANLELMTQG